MEADSPDHEERIRTLEHRVADLACEIKLLSEHLDKFALELRAEIASVVSASEARMRAYADTRLAELEQRLTARIVALEQGQRWIIGLLITLLLGVVGGMAGVIGILTRILEKLA
jgi:hypothetical protein